MTNWTVYCPFPSASARSLARIARTLRHRTLPIWDVISPDGGRPIINWGVSREPMFEHADLRVANRPRSVGRAVSKRESYRLWADQPWSLPVLRPEETQRTRHEYIVRRDGLSRGRGIMLWDGRELEEGEFLTLRYPKTHEFRAHVAFGKVIDFTQKKWRGEGDRIGLVRSHENGWIHAHNNIILLPEDQEIVEGAAVAAVRLLGLDFGAVDILARLDKNEPRRLRDFRICEVNTAPGLANHVTIQAYINAFNVWSERGINL